MKEKKVGICSLVCNTSGVKGACWNFGMGTRTNDKWVNYSHGLAQTKQEVGYCIVITLLMHEQITGIHRFIRLTIAQTWESHPPSPL
jgi:hypothetical protein